METGELAFIPRTDRYSVLPWVEIPRHASGRRNELPVTFRYVPTRWQEAAEQSGRNNRPLR